MSDRNLLLDPCWRDVDLGKALPDSPHAVSVALPRWKDVVNYEEKEVNCINSLQAIYPRFGLNPIVKKVANYALKLQKLDAHSAWPYPNIASAQKAQNFCLKSKNSGDAIIRDVLGLKCLITDSKATPFAQSFWQHTGLGASSRLAAIALKEEQAPTKLQGEEARRIIRRRLSEIYGCNEDLISLHPSGMAALTTALLSIKTIYPDKNTIQLGFPYVDVLKLPQVIFGGSELILETNPNFIAAQLDRYHPSAVIVELPSNPMLRCVDLQAISKIAHERGVPVIADDTIGSAVNIESLPYADLIFTSLTKSFAGRGDILAGSLIISPYSPWQEKLKGLINQSTLAPLSDADAVALEETSRDFVERLNKLNISCSNLTDRLKDHPEVARVLHPSLCENFQAIKREGAGNGCLLSFEVVGGVEKAKKVYDALQVCKGPSLGTNFTLACPYVLLAHYKELFWAEECGVPQHLLRVSVGLEETQMLWERFEKALKA